MADYDLIAFVLVNQLLDMNDADEEDWAELLKYNVLAIFPIEDWALLPMRGQLALASTIVGAKNLENYDVAFRIMCAWEEVGGCYWVAQLELMRHAVMHSIRIQLSGPDQVDFDATELKVRILTLLPHEPAKYVTHHILRMKLALLRADLLWLLDSMSASAHPYDEFVQYYDNYKLHCFVPWFLSWSVKLLKSTEDCFPPLGQGASAVLRGQVQKYTGMTHIQEGKMCDEEDDDDMSDISVSNADLEECDNGDFGDAELQKVNSAVYEGCGLTTTIAGDNLQRPPKRKFGDLHVTPSVVDTSTTIDQGVSNFVPRGRGVKGRTLFATPPPVNNYMYTSATSTTVTEYTADVLEAAGDTESVYEGVDYSDDMQDDEEEANKENWMQCDDRVREPQKTTAITTITPNRLPCQDLRIVMDPTELHRLEHHATLSMTTPNPATNTSNHPLPASAANNIDVTADIDTDNYTYYTNATKPRAAHLTLSTPTNVTRTTDISTTATSSDGDSNSAASDDTYVTSMTMDDTDTANTGVLNHLVRSVWSIFTPSSQGNSTAIKNMTSHTSTSTSTSTSSTTTASFAHRKHSNMSLTSVHSVTSNSSLVYSVTTDHTAVHEKAVHFARARTCSV